MSEVNDPFKDIVGDERQVTLSLDAPLTVGKLKSIIEYAKAYNIPVGARIEITSLSKYHFTFNWFKFGEINAPKPVNERSYINQWKGAHRKYNV